MVGYLPFSRSYQVSRKETPGPSPLLSTAPDGKGIVRSEVLSKILDKKWSVILVKWSVIQDSVDKKCTIVEPLIKKIGSHRWMLTVVKKERTNIYFIIT